MKKRSRGVARTGAAKPARAQRAAETAPESPGLLGLQSRAGNAAVSLLVQRQADDGDAGMVATKEESSNLYDKASAAYEAGSYREAERLFERLLSGRYKHREALHTLVWSLAMCKAHLGDYDGAYELAVTYGHYGGGRADEQRLMEQIEQVRRTDTGAAGVAPPRTKDDASKLYEQATTAYEGGDFAGAATLFETLLASPVEREAALPTVVWSLAMCKAHLGDFDRAYDLALQYGRFRAGGDDRKLFEQIGAIRKGLVGEDVGSGMPTTSDEASALYEKASESFEAQQYDDAKRMFEQLLSTPIKHNEALPSVVWSLAMCRAHLGDFDGARRLALTYTQYRGTADDERRLFVMIERLQQASESGTEAPAGDGP
jgi:outer membrane protein assembly factor BamD (BamD/ComL family)